MFVNFSKMFLTCVTLIFAVSLVSTSVDAEEEKKKEENPIVVLETTHGDIKLELFAKEAPISVKNFLWYVENKYYNGLTFHRVMPNFMIQGGGFNIKMNRKEGNAPIKNEAKNGLSNDRGTIAMARTNVINSATSQFFINLKDNTFLNHKDETPTGYGYAVFGKVISGMDAVDKIAKVETQSITLENGAKHDNVPVDPVIIEKAYVLEKEKKK